MSNRIYHEACGQPTEYNLVKPKFCASCGGAFDSTVTKTIASASRTPSRRAPVVERYDDDDDDDYRNDDFVAPRKLELEIEPEHGDKLNRVSLASIANQRVEPGSALAGVSRPAVKMNKKQVKARYQELYSKLNSKDPIRYSGETE